MAACCSSPQWFSRDRMTGYGDSCGREGWQLRVTHPSPTRTPAMPAPPHPFQDRQAKAGLWRTHSGGD